PRIAKVKQTTTNGIDSTSPPTTPSAAPSGPRFPDTGGVPLVADMSSDFMSRPFDAAPLRPHLRRRAEEHRPGRRDAWSSSATTCSSACPTNLPAMLKYTTYTSKNSLYNTPPCFAIYTRPARARSGSRRPWAGSDKMAASNRAEGRAVVYGAHRRQRRLLPRHGRAGEPLADERHLPPAERGAGEALPRGGARKPDSAA
ncbi:MAG: hypothetical protein MZV70_68590, partial [Desulfobacterales bacterium]|nr:hypothetical protein [Desulfobacterales bacterium]